jgi:hypothetical protein
VEATMNDDDFYYTISNIAEGDYVWAELYNRNHHNGFSDWNDTFTMPDKGQ